MFVVKLITEPHVIEKMRTEGPSLIAAIQKQMTLSMFKVQSNVIGVQIPKFFPRGAPNIAASVRVFPAELEGTKLIAFVQAGGPRTTKETLGGPRAGQLVDYAAVQEMGAPHPWKIEPVLYSIAWALSTKSRATSGGLPKALAFKMGGNMILRRSVMHPGLIARPFLREALTEMKEQIVTDMREMIVRRLTE